MSNQSTQRIAALKTAVKAATAGFLPDPSAVRSALNLAVAIIEEQQADIEALKAKAGA
jgi:hypothetical protein